MSRIRRLRRVFAAAFAIVTLAPLTFAQRKKEATTHILLPIRINGKWGYINRFGKIVIKPRFWVATDFSEARAWVRGEDTWFYLVDEAGKRVSAGKYYRYANQFSEGLAAVQGESSDDKIGFIDRSGKIAISPQYDGFTGEPLSGFHDGLAIVASDAKLGYINKQGDFVIGPKFDHAWPFVDGVATVSINSEEFYIDLNGQHLFAKSFVTAFGFSEGVASVSFDRQKFGLIDRSGMILLPPTFDWISGFSEGLAPANLGMAWHGHQKSGGKWGFIDKTGRIVIETKYDVVNGFADGLAPVKLGTKWGFIDRTGTFKIKPQFDWAEPFHNGISKVTIGERVGYINIKGMYIWHPSR